MKKTLNKLLQFIKFGLVGGLNTVISLVINDFKVNKTDV